MIPKIFSFIIVLFLNNLLAQTPILKYILANSNNGGLIATTGNEYMFILEKASNSLKKLDKNGVIIKSIGGIGWGQYSFDEPVDIYATLTKVIITDKNNHRIVVFDRELNYLFEIKSQFEKNFSFSFPAGAVTSAKGYFYILDTETPRVLKFSREGDFKQEIGQYSAGVYSLTNPKRIAISENEDIFILDDNIIVVFDEFGSRKNSVSFPFEVKIIRISKNLLFAMNGNKIAFTGVDEVPSEIKLLDLPLLEPDELINDVTFFNNYLYILTANRILVYEFNPK